MPLSIDTGVCSALGVCFKLLAIVTLLPQNLDGRVDIASANPENKTVTWYANGGGTTPAWTVYTMALAASTDGVRDIKLADGELVLRA